MAFFRSIFSQSFPITSSFTEKAILVQDGRIFIITGGNTGIGFVRTPSFMSELASPAKAIDFDLFDKGTSDLKLNFSNSKVTTWMLGREMAHRYGELGITLSKTTVTWTWMHMLGTPLYTDGSSNGYHMSPSLVLIQNCILGYRRN
jgi:hypothetical protein